MTDKSLEGLIGTDLSLIFSIFPYDLNNLINRFAGSILGSYDSEYGGFGTGQKFPQGRALDFSLELYELTGDVQWLKIVETTLNNQYTNINELKNERTKIYSIK